MLRAPALRQPGAVQAAYATIAATQIQLLTALAGQIPALEEVLARVLASTRTLRSTPASLASVWFLVPGCFLSSETTPTATTTRKPARTTPGLPDHPRLRPQSVVLARYARNRRLGDTIHQWAFCALTSSPGARVYYDTLRARGIGHHAACANSGTDWSASCTAASKPAPATTRSLPGHTTRAPAA